MIFEGKEFLKVKEYIQSGLSPFERHETIKKYIKTLGFPGVKLGKHWFVDVKGAELWKKRRAQKAS